MKKIEGKTYLTERKEIVDFMKEHPCIRLDFTKPSSGWKMGGIPEEEWKIIENKFSQFLK